MFPGQLRNYHVGSSGTGIHRLSSSGGGITAAVFWCCPGRERISGRGLRLCW